MDTLFKIRFKALRPVFLISIAVTIWVMPGMAQTEKTAAEKYEEFRKKALGEYDSFRQKCNDEYVAFIRQVWQQFKMQPTKPKPKEEPIPPVVLPIEEREKPIESRPIPFDNVLPAPTITPQPQPIEPIKITPVPIKMPHSFVFFGTSLEVSLTPEERFHLKSCEEDAIADTWQILADGRFDGLLTECLSIREKRNLCDWAYLLMLRELTDSFLGKGSNEATLLAGFLYCQSGYKMRFARQNGHLCILYSTLNYLYDRASWIIDGERFYAEDNTQGDIYVCKASYPRETALSLAIPKIPTLDEDLSEQRTRTSSRYPEIQANITNNKNLINFYATYPTSMYNDDFGTRWAFYANTPASEEIRQQLYPYLREAIQGVSQQEAGNRLLNWVQTGFEYAYDNEIWGEDRAFFPDESLFYPYCDCEDRSILFSRLVRDLMGLEVILLYYPGHLATAVCFTENVPGDYLIIKGKRYVVCDPTFINAPVGYTMDGMDNSTAHVILLE